METEEKTAARRKFRFPLRLTSFTDFIREHGVVGLAVGFALGSAASQLVQSLVNDVVNPLLSLLFGIAGGLREETFSLGGATLSWGNFAAVFVNFLVILLVVFAVFKLLRLDRLRKPKQ